MSQSVSLDRPQHLRLGFILNLRQDLIWFLGLPLLAIAVAFACHNWVSAVALASITLWITVPHHFATWLRTYGYREDWQRWKVQLIVGPVVIFGLTMAGLVWAPLTVFMLSMLWDHQHSVMQQHGFSRIYDFKAQAGSPWTRRFDLALNIVLYVNLFLTAPLFSTLWIRELHRWQIFISAETVRWIYLGSWSLLATYAVVYLAHIAWCWRQGYALNPIKYWFLAASYFLWYFTAWQFDSVLVWGIAHRIMHGIQYIVIVYWYLRRKTSQEPVALRAKSPPPEEPRTEPAGDASAAAPNQPTPAERDVPAAPPKPPKPSIRSTFAGLLVQRSFLLFLAFSLLYAVAYQLIIGQSLATFGFGFFSFQQYSEIPELGIQQMDARGGYEVFALTMINAMAMTHYYVDSFIWKVRDNKVQGGL